MGGDSGVECCGPASRPGDLLLPIHIRKGDLDLRLFSTIMTLCGPQDITLQELRIETWFPADQDSERCWQQCFAECAAPAKGLWRKRSIYTTGRQ